ncbi:MAG: hypothetical protein IPJ65_27975 [Archangiaceae bacterium]|nr:hypothetical protein [Archangiaceae bacterium]
MLTPLVLALTVAAQPPVSGERPRLAVLDLATGAGVDAQTAGPFGEAIAAEVQRRGFFEVISQRDISTMLGLERQKQLLGCSEEAQSCLAELSGALGARFVLSGTLARLGDAWQLTLNTLDTKKAQPLGRATRLAKDLAALQATLPYAVAEATATPAPPAKSRVLPYTLVGVGAATAVVGLLLGALALNNQGQLQGELDSGAERPGILDTRASYQRAAAGIERTRWAAIGCLAGGVALAALGLVLMPRDEGATQVALLPGRDGLTFALGGSF